MEQEQLEKHVNEAIKSMHGDRNLHRVLSYLFSHGISHYGIGEEVRAILGMSLTPLNPLKEAWQAEEESMPMPSKPFKPTREGKHQKPKPHQQPKVKVP